MHTDDNDSNMGKNYQDEDNKNKWDNLSNNDEALNESDLEPDYFIDRP